ncbi:hypothetical protein V6N13_007764 [Hibiscus sabdariffa]
MLSILTKINSLLSLSALSFSLQMKPTNRFKRVASKPNKSVRLSQSSNDPERCTNQSSKSVTIRTGTRPSHKQTQRQPKLNIQPSPVSDPCFSDRTILPPHFFQIDALDLAPRLLGKFLRRDDVVLQITEVEAYRPNDSACHGRFGITPRTAPVFGPGGNAYVYLCYGLHTMLNVVADKEGVGAAVLIRACAPVCGLETIKQRRGQQTEKPILLTGPGKVGQALGISTEWSNHPLYTTGGLELLDGPEPDQILIGPRVGIEYALPEHVNAPWRFAIAGTPWISAPKNTLRPP